MTGPPIVDPADCPDPAGVLDDVEAFLGRFVAFPSEAAKVAVTLWAAHCHAVEAFDSTPRLALLSPEPGSGKTRTLEVLELLTPRPMMCLSASPAAIFRSVQAEQPSLLFDEVDSIFSRRGADDGAEDLRALLNAGHRKGATIPRCVGPSHAVARFPVYAATALAGLGDLPDTLMSRSLIVRMRRRAPNEAVEPFRHRLHADAGHILAGRLAAWMTTIRDDLAVAWPDMPNGIVDRPADAWEPLVAVADAAGGAWPGRAREACVELCKVAQSRDASLGVRLLSDLRDVFGDTATLSTEAILDRLHKIEEAPWADLRGRPLDPRGLAGRLRRYEVASTKVKVDGRALQGYRREDLWDAWTRYLSPTPQEAEPPEPPEPCRSQAASVVPDGGPVPEPRDAVPEPAPRAEPENRALTSEVPEVPQVPPLWGGTAAAANGQAPTVEPAEPDACDICGRTCSARTGDRHAHPVCVARAAAEAEGVAS